MKETNPVGRPSKYRQEMNDIVIDLMKDGASKVEVCAALDISRTTFYFWQQEHPEFMDTVEKGELLAEAWWTQHARQNLFSKDFNHRLFFNCMKNMFNWSEKQQHHVTTAPAEPCNSVHLQEIIDKVQARLENNEI